MREGGGERVESECVESESFLLSFSVGGGSGRWLGFFRFGRGSGSDERGWNASRGSRIVVLRFSIKNADEAKCKMTHIS